ncbi:efflux RND transporter permease subunit [Rhizobium johnstonii]|uniref:Transmembrane RND family transporter n=1 Tax=Rhizobium johnstonii (strain DSM 114642 / LMG 32736 / 3841) TaxID=216596 RepID=Q1MJB2_RHIJ3|nr:MULTISPECIES: efflux RND transporter permease subunit [Rhizobium]WSH09439.1 efflux RND transporter permease subunit [Rhizobium johnstonii]MBY5342901.1 efflux RND transporter permease subunit [Rhizobium leguminosarum]MBY5373054.1 efflux RND transporter permease subunit [Rhizobium leguminosarum]MBY5388042.1 efflux RND transporter permease subunit [Rhizobium leguminosarum]MBY5428635.1 efflux RND transporter permease subunit [Rhizobium leguminosarum]
MIPNFCIQRPVATTLLAIGVILAGLAGYQLVPVAALPQVDFPTINVSAQLSGASPQTMATSVSTPLIKQFETIPGITEISASSSLGSTSIVLQFDLSRNIDAAAADVQAAISHATRQLPDNLTTPPSYRKTNPADAPVMLLSVQSNTMPRSKLDDIAENIISPSLSTLPGVAQVSVYGAQTYAVRVEVDPNKLLTRGIGIDTVNKALAAANSQQPVGTLQNNSQSMTITANTQRTSAEQFRSLVIANPNGAPIHLGDIADVQDSVENQYTGSWYDGQRGIILAIQRQPDANTVDVVDAINAKLPQLHAEIPPSVNTVVMNDAAKPIRDAISDVKFTLLLTIGLVVLVIYLFTGHATATIIPGLAVPLSLISTFGMMYVLGYSIDNISLLGLTLAVGLVVDDAIVMLENILRHVEEGMPVREAAIKGAGEVSYTIISMSVSLIAVFIPILLMGGVVGRVFNEFGMVVAIAIISSAIVSLTVTPMLASRLSNHQSRPPLIIRIFDAGFERTLRGYDRAVGWCLRHRPTILGVFLASVALTIYFFMTLPTSFFPQEDIGRLTISTQARQDISYTAMAALQQQAAAVVKANPAVNHVMSTIGGNPNKPQNNGSMFVELKDKKERAPLDQTLRELRTAINKIPGLQAFVTPNQSLRFGGRQTASQYQLVVQALNADQTNLWAGKIQAAMRKDRLFTDVTSDAQNNALQANIVIDTERAAAYGIDNDTLRTTLQESFSGYAAAEIQSTGDSYDVIVEYDTSKPWDDQKLSEIRVASANGSLVPLSNFAHVERTVGPVTINQTGQLVSTTVSFNLPEGVSLSDATAAIDQIKTEMSMPADVFTSYGGTAQIFEQSQGNTPYLILAAVLTIYVVLGVLYESFIHPLTILSGLPAAAFGALLALKIMGFDLSIIALIGLLMLIGIVKKNAIMMIDVAVETMRTTGEKATVAIHEACVRRFRPIMMTTFCALLGALPIALGTGASSELRQPLGIAVVGGLIVSQMLTLFITPVIFVEMDRFGNFLGRLIGHKKVEEPQLEEARAMAAE